MNHKWSRNRIKLKQFIINLNSENQESLATKPEAALNKGEYIKVDF